MITTSYGSVSAQDIACVKPAPSNGSSPPPLLSLPPPSRTSSPLLQLLHRSFIPIVAAACPAGEGKHPPVPGGGFLYPCPVEPCPGTPPSATFQFRREACRSREGGFLYPRGAVVRGASWDRRHARKPVLAPMPPLFRLCVRVGGWGGWVEKFGRGGGSNQCRMVWYREGVQGLIRGGGWGSWGW